MRQSRVELRLTELIDVLNEQEIRFKIGTIKTMVKIVLVVLRDSIVLDNRRRAKEKFVWVFTYLAFFEKSLIVIILIISVGQS